MSPLKFFAAVWVGIKQFFTLRSNPQIVVCAWCKKILHAPKAAKDVSHGCCWLCFYKMIGGAFPKLPRLADFAMYLDLFRLRPVVHDEAWSGQTIYRGLLENGRIERRMRDAQQSLTAEQRSIISTVRAVAAEYGFSRNHINDAEMSGWRGDDAEAFLR